jgi:hypothetical protein
VTYQISEQPAAMVQEEDFAKQLGLARYLAASSLPPARPLEPVLKGRAPKQERSVKKAGPKAKAEPARQKAGEAELAKERQEQGKSGGRRRHRPVSVGTKSSDLGLGVDLSHSAVSAP